MPEPSPEVRLVLEAFEAFARDDFGFVERAWHPDARLTGPSGWPEPGPFEGREQIEGQFRRLAADMGKKDFRDVEVVIERDGWVVISFLWDVRGAGSGAAITSKMAVAHRFEEGAIKESHFRWTPDEAFEAAGLSAD